MFRYVPIVVGIAFIVGLTIVEIGMTDRFAGANINAEQQAKLLSNIPVNFEDWRGVDMDVDAQTRQTAGAVGAVSRRYRNVRTGEEVDLWLIVGHARDISAHVPNTCYKASGFEQRAPENSLYPMIVQGQPEAPFWTNTFVQEDLRGRRLRRVFWSWYNPSNEDNKGKVIWQAPSNPRYEFGNARALYKMYFTSEMRDPLETTDQSACLAFARDFMPIVNKALEQAYDETAGAAGTASTATTPQETATPAEAAVVQEKATDAAVKDAAEPSGPAGVLDTEKESSGTRVSP